MTPEPDAGGPRAGDPRAPRALWRRVAGSPAGLAGATIVTLVVAGALLAPLLAPHDPLAPRLVREMILRPPGAGHLLGTDSLGRDLLSRVLHGTRTSLAIAGGAVGMAALAGVILGAVAGTLGGWWERVTMRIMDSMLAFPVLVLAIAVSVALGRGAIGAVVAIAAINVPTFTRLARAQTLRLEGMQFMIAARVMGAGAASRILRHTVPNMLNPIVVQASVALSFAILLESGLSFLGLGIQPPAPSLGFMVAEARDYMAIAPHVVFVPAGAIFVAVLGLNLLGDALTDALDPAGGGA